MPADSVERRELLIRFVNVCSEIAKMDSAEFRAKLDRLSTDELRDLKSLVEKATPASA